MLNRLIIKQDAFGLSPTGS